MGIRKISELMKKISKDKANLDLSVGSNIKCIGNSFPPNQVIYELNKRKQSGL